MTDTSVGEATDLTEKGDLGKPWPLGRAHPGIAKAIVTGKANEDLGTVEYDDPKVVSDADAEAIRKAAITNHLINAAPDFAGVDESFKPPPRLVEGTQYMEAAEAAADAPADPPADSGAPPAQNPPLSP